ncbi:unnamed protein product [Laminaria digitata]
MGGKFRFQLKNIHAHTSFRHYSSFQHILSFFHHARRTIVPPLPSISSFLRSIIQECVLFWGYPGIYPAMYLGMPGYVPGYDQLRAIFFEGLLVLILLTFLGFFAHLFYSSDFRFLFSTNWNA